MSGLHLFTSNKLELLVEKLTARMRGNPLPFFQSDLIVVQSKGMQHWLSLEIAERNGICANCEFPFPKLFVYTLFREVVQLPEEDLYSLDLLTWKTMAALPSLLDHPDFKTLRNYSAGGRGGIKLYQLSEKIAAQLDQYLIYRPDLINQWDSGHNPLAETYEESRWQYRLWREITRTERESGLLTHPAALKKVFSSHPPPWQTVPSRISVFGISSLPPFYLDILTRLSETVEVDFYYLNPCRHYWEYCYGEKEVAGFLKAGISEEEQYYERGNPLLASMGVAGREFFSLILAALGDTGDQNFASSDCLDLLHRVQTDILNLVDRGGEERAVINPSDRSIQIHSCHSAIREVEVLYDTLLALFEENKDLAPRDVVVMMPDISIYAPLIQAVFDAREADGKSIPYSMADLSLSSANAIVRTFLSLLTLDAKRFRLSDVLDILESIPVRQKFGFDEADIDRIKTWVTESGICWGVDGSYKEDLGLPGFEENTWLFGLKRMLLGISLSENDPLNLYESIAPYTSIEGDAVVLLGRFVSFVESLIETCGSIRRDRKLAEWSQALVGVLDDFFQADETSENHLQEIRETLLEKGLLGLAVKSGFTETVPAEVVICYLGRRLEKDLRSTGFISRGVTFCTLLPMRSIPFHVVYIMGMNEGDFPRRTQRSGFDLLEKEKRLCDRSKRDEDKYLFLESLLSARHYLIISYIGQSIKDNSDRPPSVLVSELCDVLEKGFVAEDGGSILPSILVKHPLQPFSPRYFLESSPLFSFSRQNCEAARANCQVDKETRRFISQDLPPSVSDVWTTVSSEQFTRFFQDPCGFFLKNRLSIHLRLDDEDMAEDREPFTPDALQTYRLKQEYLSFRLQHDDDLHYYESLKARGVLAHGVPGQRFFEKLKTDTSALLQSLKIIHRGGLQPPLAVAYQSESPTFLISGFLTAITQKGQVFHRAAKVKARDLLLTWVHHLLLNASDYSEGTGESYYVGTDKIACFSPLPHDQATDCLQHLVEIFHRGWRSPLPFFPETSLAFARKERTGKTEEAQTAAEKSWNSGYMSTGEKEIESIALCFGDDLPWGDEFTNLAVVIYKPLLEHLEEKKIDDFLSTP